MATVNILTGVAHGKIGVLQYQSRGLKCVVRSKQPEGLTNSQAEDVNKPVLQHLSGKYHLWARYMLSHFATGWKKPQAAWNYFTEVNRPSFTGGVTALTGWYVNKRAGALVPSAVYYPDSGESSGRLEFSTSPPLEYLNYDVLLIFGLDKLPIDRCQKIYAPYAGVMENLPFVEVAEDETQILGFIVSRDHAALISGAFPVTAGPDAGIPFWNAPADFIANGVTLHYTALTVSGVTAAVAIDEDAVPSRYTGFKWRFTFSRNLGSHASGSITVIPRNTTLPVTADCEVWDSGETVAAVVLLDPAETTVCSPAIPLNSAFTRPQAAAFGLDSPNPVQWAATLSGVVSLSYTPVMAAQAPALSVWTETLTFTQPFGSIARGTSVENLFKAVYTQGNISGTPPISGPCAQSRVSDSRTGVAVCAAQNAAASRRAIDATAAQLAPCLKVYQTGLLWQNINIEAKLGAPRIPAQYQDCLFRITFDQPIGGQKKNDVVTMNVTQDKALAAGPAFPDDNAAVSHATLQSPDGETDLSPPFSQNSGYEVLTGGGQSPFWVKIVSKVFPNRDVSFTLRIQTDPYKTLSYYPGSIEIHFTRPVYGDTQRTIEGVESDYPIHEGAEGWGSDEEGTPYRGQNGACYFTRETNTHQWPIIAQNIYVYSDY
jgi:hypothetical protein